ncbi:phage terminase small subunit P27 family [Clostridium tetani]|uniref:P27 family phage terminase small subunit n=1 Tax=Clostridium tetani TaxID=1513 RepID=UPI00100B347E|nr:P27 family phage terminase small subunit [Clostridium tetani]RXI50186.1 phage terminase small subunit P27 family [Clostridium tetani]
MSEAKPIELTVGHRTKEEIEKRKEQQEKLKGKSNKIEPTQKLNQNQTKIFYLIKSEMAESEVLCNLDSYMLTQFSIAIDKLAYLDELVEKKPGLILNKDFKSSKKLYFDIFTKCCTELSMSPQSRAKLANINSLAQQDKEDPIIKALQGDDD